MTEQQKEIPTWIQEEAKQLKTSVNYEQLPALKLVASEITEFDVDTSKPFEKWNGEDGNGKSITKKIIPATHLGVRKNFWLNTANPLYKEMITALSNGIKHFKVLQTGTAQNTKYVLVK